jgi:translation initiation factor 2 alpha subunit (eIF-2alpha)
VNVDDEEEGERKYNNSTQLHSILIHIWPLYRTGKYDHPLTFLKQLLVYEEKQEELGIEDEKIKKCLLDELRRRFKRPVIKTMANFSVSCRTIKGIDAIKKALHGGIEAAKEKGYDVKIFIIGAPKYTCEVSSATVESGREALNHALKAIEEVMKEESGDYSLDKQVINY